MALAIATIGTLTSAPARAQPPEGPTFDLDITDTALIGFGFWATALGLGAQAQRWSGTPACRGEPEPESGICAGERIFVLDRPTFAHDWRGADTASDVLLFGMLASPFAYSGARVLADDRVADPGRTFGRASALSFQALGAVLLATVVLKMIVRRPRPLTYDAQFSEEERFDGDARLSFPSGHTSMAFGAASLVAIMAHEELSDSGLQAAAMAGAFGAASAVGYFRIAARKHFLTDVLAGAVLGGGLAAAIGWAQLADEEETGEGDGTGSGAFHFSWGGTF